LLGYSVGASETDLILGAPGDFLWENMGKGAYIFCKIAGQWWNDEYLEYPARNYGVSVAISSNTLVIDGTKDDDMEYDAGSAFVLENIDDIWTEMARITAPDAAPNDNFGNSVSCSGNWIAAGAPMAAIGGQASGKVYVFDLQKAEWIQTAVLSAPEGVTGSKFCK
jgi:hypothetical protein